MRVRSLFTVLLLSMGLGLSEASERPEWVDAGSKKEDALYRYYVGRGVARSEAEAFGDARREAQAQAVRENFGTVAQIELRALEDTRSSRTLKAVDEEFPKVSFQGFEQMEFFKQQLAPRRPVEVWVLFRYSKATIAKEKLRLAKGLREPEAALWSEQGASPLIAKKGALEVSSEPPGAEVFVDDKRYGVTPLRLMGVLDPGPYNLTLDHAEFAIHHERVEIKPGQLQQVSKKLRKALGHLSITTKPSGAQIRIEGHPAGLSPVRLFPVSAGKSISIEITSDKALPLQTQVRVARDRHEIRHFDLEPKLNQDPRSLSSGLPHE